MCHRSQVSLQNASTSQALAKTVEEMSDQSAQQRISDIKLKEYVLDNVLDAAYLMDSQLRFVYVNNQAWGTAATNCRDSRRPT
jgi:hypothetical protein